MHYHYTTLRSFHTDAARWRDAWVRLSEKLDPYIFQWLKALSHIRDALTQRRTFFLMRWINAIEFIQHAIKTFLCRRESEVRKPRFISPQKMNVISLVPWTYVSHPLPSVSMRSLSVIVRWTCGQCPEHLRFSRCMSGSSLAANQVHRTETDAKWTSTRQGTHEFLTQSIPPHSYRTSSGCLFPVESIPCTKLSAGLNGRRLTRSAFAEWETDKKRMRTETNELKILFSVGRPLRYPVRRDRPFNIKMKILIRSDTAEQP